METTFLLRFKKQPSSFKKWIQHDGKDTKWYEPVVAAELYQEVVKNTEVNGILEVELKCLASNKKIANVRFEIDRGQALDVLIYNTLHEETEKMGAHEGLVQLLEDLRHAFKWDEKVPDKKVEKKESLKYEIESIDLKNEESSDKESTEDEQSLVDITEITEKAKPKLTIEADLFDDLEDDWTFDEALLVSASMDKSEVENFQDVGETNILDAGELSPIVLLRRKMTEIETMIKKGVDHLLDVFYLTGKTDPISVKKQHFIKDNYEQLFLAFLRKEYQCYGEKKQSIKAEAQEQLDVKCHDIQSENYELVELELESVRLELETTFERKKQAEIKKLEAVLKQEFEETLHTRRVEIEQNILSNFTPEQELLMKTCRDEVELMIKASADVVVDENTMRYQAFMNEITTDLQFKQLEFEREQDRLELKRMQDQLMQAESSSKESQHTQIEIMLVNQQQIQKQMMEMMQRKDVEMGEEKPVNMLVYIIVIVTILIAFGFLFLRLDFVREAIAGFLS